MGTVCTFAADLYKLFIPFAGTGWFADAATTVQTARHCRSARLVRPQPGRDGGHVRLYECERTSVRLPRIDLSFLDEIIHR